MEKRLNQLVDKLKQAHGANLVSVILYGSAAAGDYQGAISDLNVFCSLRQVGIDELRKSEKIVQWWRDLGNPSPLLMTPDEIRRSADCFPIEFHDMQERRRLLFGEDVLAGLTIDDRYYRARVEYELRAKLLRLRQKAAGVYSDRSALLLLMEESISTFCVLGRHALRLRNGDAPWTKRDIVAALAAAFGLAATPLDTLLDLREQKMKPRQVDPPTLFDSYLREITVLVDAVDRIPSQENPS
jgi:predicted nucleotidyltransferase